MPEFNLAAAVPKVALAGADKIPVSSSGDPAAITVAQLASAAQGARADAALPRTGGVLSGPVTFAEGQGFPGTLAAYSLAFHVGDASPRPITTLAAGCRVLRATLVVTTAFDGAGARLCVGDDGDPGRLIPPDALVPHLPSALQTHPFHRYAVETAVRLTITPGTNASTGAGFVLLEISP